MKLLALLYLKVTKFTWHLPEFQNTNQVNVQNTKLVAHMMNLNKLAAGFSQKLSIRVPKALANVLVSCQSHYSNRGIKKH